NRYGLQALIHTDAQNRVRIGALVTTSAFGLTSATYDFVKSTQGWTTFGPFTPSASATWVWPDMQGAIRFFGDHGADAIEFSLWKDGQVLTAGQIVNGGRVSDRQTQLDGQNNLHVFWTGTVPIPGSF